MPFIDPNELEVKKPELFFGLSAAVGTPLAYVIRILNDQLSQRGYTCDKIQLSDLLYGINLKTPIPQQGESEFMRISKLMDRGNELRNLIGSGEALVLLAIADINTRRPKEGKPHLPGKAFILRQLKHPDEVFWLRTVYGTAFHLIGVYCPEAIRRQNLIRHFGMTKDEANKLIERDMDEKEPYGQHLRDTFYLSDVFISMQDNDTQKTPKVEQQLERYFALLFAERIVTPTVDEYGMHLAYSASLRSADLSRQVGAAILTPSRDVISLGSNEVPTAGGGQYWEGDENDSRDAKRGFDSNTAVKRDIVREMLEILKDDFSGLDQTKQEELIDQMAKLLAPTRLMHLTEFGRAVLPRWKPF